MLTDGRTDVTKLKVVFGNFANTPKTDLLYRVKERINYIAQRHNSVTISRRHKTAFSHTKTINLVSNRPNNTRHMRKAYGLIIQQSTKFTAKQKVGYDGDVSLFTSL